MMRTVRAVLVCAVVLAVSVIPAAAQKQSPVVSSATLSGAGDTLFISGSGFGSAPVVTLGAIYLDGVTVIRATFAQSAVMTPGAGTFAVGLCGKADGGQATNWNSNEYGYVSAIMF